MSEDTFTRERPGREWRTKWSTLDLKQANDLLDKIGLTKKDAEGFRVRTDNGQPLRFVVTTVAAAFIPYNQIMEMVSQHWKKIGVHLDVKDTERTLSLKQVANNEQQFYVWGGGNADIFMWPRHDMPAEPNEPFSGTLYAERGTLLERHRWQEARRPQELLKAYDILRQGFGVEGAERNKLGQELKKIIVDQQWVIGTVGFTPTLRVISNKLTNVPDRYVWLTRNPDAGCRPAADLLVQERTTARRSRPDIWRRLLQRHGRGLSVLAGVSVLEDTRRSRAHSAHLHDLTVMARIV